MHIQKEHAQLTPYKPHNQDTYVNPPKHAYSPWVPK